MSYTKMSAGNGKDPEFAKNDSEQIDIKRLPPKIQKVLDKYDVDGDAPGVPHAGFQGWACVRDVVRCGRKDGRRSPDVTVLGTRDGQRVGALFHSTNRIVVRDFPGEARSGIVDAQRIPHVVCAEITD